MFHETIRYDEVVQSPANVLSSSVLHVSPERVSASTIWIEVTECVGEAIREKFIKTLAFFFGETGGTLVCLRISEVNFLVTHVHITYKQNFNLILNFNFTLLACNDDRFDFIQSGDMCVENFVPAQTFVQCLQAAS